jgi:hypothetical protein
MATSSVNYSSPTTITMDLANLASDANLLAGRESTQIDNTTNKYEQVHVQGSVTVGTTPTVGGTIQIYLWGSDTSLGTTARDVLDGTDSAETITNAGVRNSLLKLVDTVTLTANTSDIAYPVGPFEVSQWFGAAVPRYWGLFVVHNTGVNLRNNAVNTNAFSYVGIKRDIA